MAPDPNAPNRATVESYDRIGSSYQVHIDCDWRRCLDEYTLLPLLDSLQLAGSTVLDVGAGTGRWTRAALRRGAAVVHTLEPSAKMADAARQLEHKEREAAKAAAGGDSGWSYGRVHHLLGDVVDSDLNALTANVAIMGYLLQYLCSEDSVLRALRNVYRALSSGGRLLGVSFCIEADAPLEQHSTMPRYSIILPDGNEEWSTANASFADPPFNSTIFVQRWATLQRLMKEAGFRRVERIESCVDEALLSTMTVEEADAMLRYAKRCAFFCAEK